MTRRSPWLGAVFVLGVASCHAATQSARRRKLVQVRRIEQPGPTRVAPTRLAPNLNLPRACGRDAHYHIAPFGLRQQMKRFMQRWITGAPHQAPRGFEARVLSRGLFAVGAGRRAFGHGLYFLRRTPRAEVVVEVPHSCFDRHTRAIGLALFEYLQARALLINTVHRYRAAGCDRAGLIQGCASDLARRDDSVFHAVHRGLVEGRRCWVVAIHGFRRFDDTQVIVSAAGTRADPSCFADHLRRWRPDLSVVVYGVDARRLGGTTGAQARHLRRIGGRMIHLELSEDLRRSLARQVSARRGFVAALAPCFEVDR